MRKVRNTLPIVLAAFAILGVLAVAGHADKPVPVEPPSVELTEGLVGEGNPEEIRVTFDSSLAFAYPADCTQGPLFISNPDRPPSLSISGPGMNMKQLKYYYCAYASHYLPGSSALVCKDDTHHPYHYCLLIGSGTQKKSAPGRVVFPVGSPWNISSEAVMKVVISGTLSVPVTYNVTRWSTSASAE